MVLTDKISKSLGLTSTEQFLSRLCDRTFLKLWSYPNPFRERGKELCDLIAVFENHVFLFFDRESKAFAGEIEDFNLAWERWKKEAVTKQIKSAKKARNHVLRSRDQIYLDAACTIPFPVKLPAEDLIIHCAWSKRCLQGILTRQRLWEPGDHLQRRSSGSAILSALPC
jgi:hypothetical protein